MTDLDRKFQEVRRNQPPDLWSSIGTRLPVEPVSAPRRRWPVLIVAILVGIGGLALAWEGFRNKPAQVPASAPVLTSPAPRRCPWGIARVSTVSTEQFLQLTNGRGPTWLPEGFGLAQTWSDHADWSDGTCREVTMSVYGGTQAPPRGVLGSVGDWLVVVDAPGSCGNAVLGRGRCLDYVAPTRDGLTFGLQMMGIGRPVGDRIALSISLEPGPSPATSLTPTSSTSPIVGLASWASTGSIIYKCGDALCVMRPDGSGEHDLLPSAGPWPQWDAAVSPNGKMVAFRGYYGSGDGQYALYVAGTDGCGVQKLTSSIASLPSWSPDGQWIAFDTSGGGEIWKVRPNGSGLTRIAQGRGGAEDMSPVWSPDGNNIAFVRETFSPSQWQLWVMDADGNGTQLLHEDAQGLSAEPAWSHDGTKIAFTASSPNGRRSWIEVMNADGTNVQALTSEQGNAWNPVWLPNDAGIAFLTKQNAAVSLLVMRPDGSDVAAVAPSLGADQFTWVSDELPPPSC